MHWYKTHMHLHAAFEQFASIRSHAEIARRLGFDALFITEHDVRMNHMENGIERFVLTKPGEALRPDGAGWRCPDGTPCKAMVDGENGTALRIRAGEEAVFSSPGKKHQASLLADLTLEITLSMSAGVSLRVDVALSLRPDQTQQHLYYEIGACPGGESTAWRVAVAAPLSEDGTLRLPLSEDVLRFDEFGQDNAFCSVSLSAFGEGEVWCHGFTTTRLYVAEAVRRRQQVLADRIGAAWSLRIYAANEISLPGGHRNSYSAHVPVIDYGHAGFDLSTAEVCARVVALRGTLSLNHPFERWKRYILTPEERAAKVEELAEEMLTSRAEGAQLIEVGFPEGRSGFSLAEHLRLWDNLALHGLILTGYGDSDCHDSRKGWLEGNNFATWLCARSVERTDLEETMRTGRAYMGDPARWRGEVRFSVGGADMGGLLPVGEQQDASLDLELDGITEPLRCVVVMAGEILNEAEVCGPRFCLCMAVCRGLRPIVPVRVELYARDGRCILLTNPVYLTLPAMASFTR